MKKFYQRTFRGILLLGLLVPVLAFAEEPTKTPAQVALGDASQAFIGKVVSQKEVASPSQYRTTEATVEVLIPLLGVVPNEGSLAQVIYHTEVGVDPCLEVELLKDGFVGLFTFAEEQALWSEPRILNYCLDRRMDFFYEVTNSEASVSRREVAMSLRLVSGSWSGVLAIPVPKVSSYTVEPLAD
jgi:hypothetical protein